MVEPVDHFGSLDVSPGQVEDIDRQTGLLGGQCFEAGIDHQNHDLAQDAVGPLFINDFPPQ
jgi:hypothetical protein